MESKNLALKELKAFELAVTTLLHKITFVSSIDQNNVSTVISLHEFLSNIGKNHFLKIYLGQNVVKSISQYIHEEVERIGHFSLEKLVFIWKRGKSIPFIDIIDGYVDVFVEGSENEKEILKLSNLLNDKELPVLPNMKKWVYPEFKVSSVQTIQPGLSDLLFSLFDEKFVKFNLTGLEWTWAFPTFNTSTLKAGFSNFWYSLFEKPFVQADFRERVILEQLREMISPVKLVKSNERSSYYDNVKIEPITKERFIEKYTEKGALCGRSCDINDAIPYARNGITIKGESAKTVFYSGFYCYWSSRYIQNIVRIATEKDIRVWKIPFNRYNMQGLKQYFAEKPVDIIVISKSNVLLILNPAVVSRTSLRQIMKDQYEFFFGEKLDIYFFLYKISVLHQIEGVSSPVDHPKIREYMLNRDRCSISDVFSFFDTFLETKDDFNRITKAENRLTLDYLDNLLNGNGYYLMSQFKKILDLVSSYFRKENIDFDFWAEFLGKIKCKIFSNALRKEKKPIFTQDSEIAKLLLANRNNENVKEWIILTMQLKYKDFPNYGNVKVGLFNLVDDFVSVILRKEKFEKETLIILIEIILTQFIIKAKHLHFVIPLLSEDMLIRFVHHENNQFQINFLQELDNRTRKSESQAKRIGSLLGKYYLQTGHQIPLCEFRFCYFAYLYLSDLNIEISPEITGFYSGFDKKYYCPALLALRK